MPGRAPAPPFYRPNDINPITEYLEAKAELAEGGGGVVVDVSANRDDGDFGDIAAEEELTFTFWWDDPKNSGTLRTLVAAYEGDEDAFWISKIFGVSTDPLNGPVQEGPGALFAIVLPEPLKEVTSSFSITALAEDDGVEKTGTLTFSWSVTVGQGGPELGETILSIPLSKRYVAP